VNRQGDIIIMREDFLKALKTDKKNTHYALNFVALAFGEMKNYIEKESATNRIPNQRTLFKKINPVVSWKSVYDEYHEYMSGIYETFSSYLKDFSREKNINNFNDFVEEYYLYCQNLLASIANPITLSGFITSKTVDSRCSGLTIDLYRSKPSNDPVKIDVFIRDVNFKFYKHAATKHGFVIDKNIPWRLIANLSSEYMKLLMESPAFNVTYDLGPRHLFDTYYLKTYTLDLILLRKYMYDMYRSYINYAPFYTEFKWCNNKKKTKKIRFNRKPLTTGERERDYNLENYWLEYAYRFRLLELDHDLTPEDINMQIKNAKSIFKIRGEMHALKFLHDKTKVFFLNNYNKLNANLKFNTPIHPPEST
jgi:hypothetical protein